MGRMRLDQCLVDRGLSATRSRARDAILRGEVTVDGAAVSRPGQRVGADATIAVAPEAERYVSRGALKLEHALDAFSVDPSGHVAVDIGASTGGFTDVLLSRGAAHVFAVDVGTAQLAPRLREDPRVTSLEQCNARHLGREQLPDPFTLVVCDVSFISLRLALAPTLALAEPGACLVTLVKPQFEAGPDDVGKGGIVRDEAVHARVRSEIAGWLGDAGWPVFGEVRSPIEGPDGNVEFLMAARHAA